MSREELMEVRFKVITPYPNSPYEIGDLVQISDTGTSFHCTTTKDYDSFREDIIEQENYFSILKISDFPNLFKKLEWWEERKESDMPEYLHCVCSDFITFVKGQIISVEKHQSNTFDQYVPWLFISKEKQSSEAMTNCFNYKNFLPATESEYLNQKK